MQKTGIILELRLSGTENQICLNRQEQIRETNIKLQERLYRKEASVRSVRCRVCGDACGSSPVMIREMMFGMRRKFPYHECSTCGCIQIENYPPDISVYYPADYYAFKKISYDHFQLTGPAGLKARILLYNHLLFKDAIGILGKKTRMPYERAFEQLRKAGIRPWSRILDVGAGNGRFLCQLHQMGFTDLTGVDKFISGHALHLNRIRIWKKEIGQLERRYDLITLHHVLEHMPHQKDVLQSLRKRLRKNGKALVRIPVKNRAWEIYKENWVQLDAPRHYYLHTLKSFSHLAENSGFRVKEIQFDSTSFQFWGSEQYLQDISLRRDERSHALHGGERNSRSSYTLFPPQQLREWEQQAEELNREGRGDQAVFYLEAEE